VQSTNNNTRWMLDACGDGARGCMACTERSAKNRYIAFLQDPASPDVLVEAHGHCLDDHGGVALDRCSCLVGTKGSRLATPFGLARPRIHQGVNRRHHAEGAWVFMSKEDTIGSVHPARDLLLSTDRDRPRNGDWRRCFHYHIASPHKPPQLQKGRTSTQK
jgi:hypothetical protein